MFYTCRTNAVARRRRPDTHSGTPREHTWLTNASLLIAASSRRLKHASSLSRLSVSSLSGIMLGGQLSSAQCVANTPPSTPAFGQTGHISRELLADPVLLTFGRFRRASESSSAAEVTVFQSGPVSAMVGRGQVLLVLAGGLAEVSVPSLPHTRNWDKNNAENTEETRTIACVFRALKSVASARSTAHKRSHCLVACDVHWTRPRNDKMQKQSFFLCHLLRLAISFVVAPTVARPTSFARSHR